MPIRYQPRPGVVAPLLLFMAVPCMTMLSGCQQSREALAESAIGHAPSPLEAMHDHRVASVARTGSLAERRGESLSLPEDFPDDVYLPRDYRINSVMDRAGLRVISLQAPGRVPGLFGAARAAMGRHGWKQTLAMQDATDNAVLTYEKDRRAAVLSFNSGGGIRGVTMSVQLRSEQL